MRYIITDIHGCVKTFRKLVAQLALRPDDTLYLLGDYVNKGPDSCGVIDFIFELREQFSVHCLRGNHDQFILDAVRFGSKAIPLTEEEKKLTLQSFGVSDFKEIPQQYISFLESLPYYLELPEAFLVHAGFDFRAASIFRNTSAMLFIKDFKTDFEKIAGKRLIHGHNPLALEKVRKAAATNARQLNLDTGCVYYKNKEFGTLVAYCPDTGKLFEQENIDKPYPIDYKN